MGSSEKGKAAAKNSDVSESRKRQDLSAAADEAMRGSAGQPVNLLGPVSLGDTITYGLENRIAANPNYPFQVLVVNTTVVIIACGLLWHFLAEQVTSVEVYGFDSYWDGIYLAAQLVMAGGPDGDTPEDMGLRWVYTFCVLFGLVVFAIVVGFITNAIEGGMEAVSSGKTKVAETGHTLILGWNEATLRAVVQISFLRRQYQIANERKSGGLLVIAPGIFYPIFRFLKLLETPSTSLSNSSIVLMNDAYTKEEMHEMLEAVLAERGISPARTKIGRDIICRVGSPTDVTDLLRVGAHRAAAILVMMSEQDQTEEDESEGTIQNGATLRATLALRHVIFQHPFSMDNGKPMPHPDLRIVLQMSHPSEYVSAACFSHADGRQVIFPVDLSKFSNSLMFNCAAQPGLSSILLDMLDFEGVAIRRRKAKNLRSGKNNALGDCVGQTFGEMRKQFSAAAFIGIVRPSIPEDEQQPKGFGLCPDMSIVIEPEDLLVFVGPRPSPLCSPEMAGAFSEYQAEASSIANKFPDIEANRNKNGLTNSKRKRTLLVCGWRPVWQDHPQRLGARIKEITSQRLPGSVIIFVNQLEEADFASIMSTIGCTSTGNNTFEMPAPFSGIVIKHVCGDAAMPKVLAPVINDHTIDGAIVLGTQANFKLAGHYRDTRVLNVILLLRKLWFDKNELAPMHVVGENTQDITAKLALAPYRFGASKVVDDDVRLEHEPDFVNNMAVEARSLVQTLAYPHIDSARSELFDDADTSSGLINVDACEYIPLGVQMKFGVVRATVLRAAGERSMCLGVVWGNGAVDLLPPHDRVVAFTTEDRLVLLRRVINKAE